MRFVAYFEANYLRKRRAPQGSGLEVMHDATWRFGMAGPLLRGHPPTQQTAEQANAKVKRDVRGGGNVLDTHMAVAEALRSAAVVWTSPYQPKDGAKPLTLMASSDEALATRSPRAPDRWMLGKQGLRGHEQASGSAAGSVGADAGHAPGTQIGGLDAEAAGRQHCCSC